MATPNSIVETPPSRDVLGGLGKLVGTPFEYGAWDYRASGTMDCIGLLLEYAKIAKFPVPWETGDMQFVKELGDQISEYGDAVEEETEAIPTEMFRQMATNVEYSTGDLKWLGKWIGREVMLEDVQPLDILFLRLLPNDPVINHIGIMHEYRKWLHVVPKFGLRLMPLSDKVKKLVGIVVRPSIFEG